MKGDKMNNKYYHQLSKHNFALRYFKTYFDDKNYIHIKTKEILNMNILDDFYDDYITSKLYFEHYKKQTQSQL
tara:strand:+ start:19 stop:237 length:219 start_codon:yes stop_codon:yes gene_type:complete